MKNYLRILLSVFMLAVSLLNADAEVLDFCTKRDLELTGSVNQSHGSVAAAIDCTKTKPGALLLRQMLENPLTDDREIMSRQAAIKQLVDNPERLVKLEKLLQYIALYEEAFTFFDPAATPESLKTVVDSFMYQTSFLESWNNKPFALNMRHTMQSFSPLITTVFEFLVLHFALEYLVTKYDKPEKGHKHKHHKHGHGHVHGPGCINCIETPEGAPTIVKVITKLIKAGHIALHVISIKDMIEFVSIKMAIMDQVYQQLCGLQAVVNAVAQAGTLFAGDGVVQSVGADLVLLNGHLADGYFSQKMGEDNGLHLFSPVGQTLVTYAAVQKEIARVEKLKHFIAQLDVYSSIARLMLDAKNSTKQFCFAEMPEARPEMGPLMVVRGGWHVMLESKNIVANEFFAFNGNHSALKFVLTGPNRSGKSSLLRMLGVNAVLAQVFGIAAAAYFKLRPFTKITSFMTITDDITAGKSSYVARMMRADDVIRMQKELSADEWALVLLDDSLGQATTVERGEKMAYEFVSTMGAFDNNIVISATHIPKLTMLAEETHGRFENMRMKIIKQADGKAVETYELESGVSDAADAGILVGQA